MRRSETSFWFSYKCELSFFPTGFLCLTELVIEKVVDTTKPSWRD